MTEATGGQRNRKNIQDTLEPNLKDFCPNPLDKMANLIAYKYHLSPLTVRYSYLPMFIDAGILVLCNGNGCYDLGYKKGNIGKNTVEESVIVDSEAEKINKLRKDKEEKPQIQQEKVKPFLELGNDLQTYLRPHKEKTRKEQIEIIKNAPINETLKRAWLKDLGVNSESSESEVKK